MGKMKHFFITVTIVPLLTGIPCPAMAATTSLNMGSALLQTIWALLIVVGIILVIYGLAKKRFGSGRIGTGQINLLEMRHIMPKTALALVEVRGKTLLIGIGSGHINLLADIADERSASDGHGQHADFKTLLAKEEEK